MDIVYSRFSRPVSSLPVADVSDSEESLHRFLVGVNKVVTATADLWLFIYASNLPPYHPPPPPPPTPYTPLS